MQYITQIKSGEKIKVPVNGNFFITKIMFINMQWEDVFNF